MPVLPYPVLNVTADFGDGEQTATFELYGGERDRASISEGVQNTQAVDNGLNNLLGLINLLTDDGEGGRAGLNIDIGGGTHTWTVSNIQLPQDATKEDGTPVQWGTSTSKDDPPTAESATGLVDVTVAQNVFNRYFVVGTPDSGQPATLEYGLYTSDSDTALDPVSVVVKNPQVEVRSSLQRLDISCVIQKTRDGSEPAEAAERTFRGTGF